MAACCFRECSAKDFLMAFARCLEPDSELGTIEEILEKRAVEYRKLGSLFGMEKVQQQFHWNKFMLTFFSDTLAVIAFPLCKLQVRAQVFFYACDAIADGRC
jgi:hypothetical protein